MIFEIKVCNKSYMETDSFIVRVKLEDIYADFEVLKKALTHVTIKLKKDYP